MCMLNGMLSMPQPRYQWPFRIKGVGASEASPTPCSIYNTCMNYTWSDPPKPQEIDDDCPGDVWDEPSVVGDLVPPSNDSKNYGCVRVVGAESPGFSTAEELQFANHFKEGYDFFDTRYEECLKCRDTSSGVVGVARATPLLAANRPLMIHTDVHSAVYKLFTTGCSYQTA